MWSMENTEAWKEDGEKKTQVCRAACRTIERQNMRGKHLQLRAATGLEQTKDGSSWGRSLRRGAETRVRERREENQGGEPGLRRPRTAVGGRVSGGAAMSGWARVRRVCPESFRALTALLGRRSLQSGLVSVFRSVAEPRPRFHALATGTTRSLERRGFGV